MEDKKLAELGAWVVQTCLLYDVPPITAYKVATVFIEGVKKEWDKNASLGT